MGGEITITDRAAEKIRVLLAAAKEGHGLRVKVVEGGCSGFEYKIDIDSPERTIRSLRKTAPASCSTRKASFTLTGRSSITKAS
jgi:Fe-S cluster assembly iron-binding protein IscA